MRRVLALSLLVLAGLTTAASANPLPPVPVSVTHGSDGSVCVTVSLQVPQCLSPSGLSPSGLSPNGTLGTSIK
jgi:hypothetical protein